MKLLLFLFGAALAAGLYFVLADLLKIPRLATERALISAGRKERSLVKSMETLILGWSLKLAPLIRLDAYKRRRLETKLTAAGLDMTPEVFTAYTVLKPCLILLGIIPCLLILPILTSLVVVLALLTYFKESRRADELCKARMELVEGELPRFVATIHQELAASRDVLRILENYKKHAGPDFARELDVLTADMRSSSYEAALIRFEARMGSAIISDIVRGLVGILRGDDGRMYFQMLSHDLKALELQRLKAKAAKIPPKIRVFSFLMLMCFMLTYIVIKDDSKYWLPNWFAPTGRTDKNPSFCRKVSPSTEILERVSSIAMSDCSSLSPSMFRAFNSMNTEQWSKGSRFLRRFASSSTTSCRFPSASMVSFTSLPPLLSLLRRVAFWMIFRCSMLSTRRW